jgi:hypothetical protein
MPHELVALNVGYIGNGQMVQRVEEALQKICRDVIERPKVAKARKVSVEITICPDEDEATGQNFPKIGFSVGLSIPGHTGIESQGIVADDGNIYINIAEPRDVLQANLFPMKDMAGQEKVVPLRGAR